MDSGYVGLPLALEFEKKKNVLGFDINERRVKELKSGKDRNLEFSKDQLKVLKKLKFTSNIEDLKSVNCYIVTVLTPVDHLNKPDLKQLFAATEMIGKFLKKGDLIIYDPQYPGCVEEECVPILEKFSNLNFNEDFVDIVLRG